MQLVSIDRAFGVLLATLGLFAPLVLLVSQAKKARVIMIALIVGSNVVGCFVAALCFWRSLLFSPICPALPPFLLRLESTASARFFSC